MSIKKSRSWIVKVPWLVRSNTGIIAPCQVGVPGLGGMNHLISLNRSGCPAELISSTRPTDFHLIEVIKSSGCTLSPHTGIACAPPAREKEWKSKFPPLRLPCPYATWFCRAKMEAALWNPCGPGGPALEKAETTDVYPAFNSETTEH